MNYEELTDQINSHERVQISATRSALSLFRLQRPAWPDLSILHSCFLLPSWTRASTSSSFLDFNFGLRLSPVYYTSCYHFLHHYFVGRCIFGYQSIIWLLINLFSSKICGGAMGMELVKSGQGYTWVGTLYSLVFGFMIIFFRISSRLTAKWCNDRLEVVGLQDHNFSGLKRRRYASLSWTLGGKIANDTCGCYFPLRSWATKFPPSLDQNSVNGTEGSATLIRRTPRSTVAVSSFPPITTGLAQEFVIERDPSKGNTLLRTAPGYRQTLSIRFLDVV